MRTPSQNPLPWATEALDRAGAFDEIEEEMFDYRTDQYVTNKRPSDHGASALLDVLTSTVAALHDDAKAYRVLLNKDAASAGTLLERRIVEVGSKPMSDTDLTDGQKAAVMMGLALHEVGHIRYSRAYRGAITRLFGAGNVTGAISTLSNLAADCHDEAEAMDAFPGLAPAIAVTLWWVGGKGSESHDVDLDHSVQHRVNAAIAATRYPWQVDWPDTIGGAEWLEWWVDWAKRARQAGQPKVHAAIVQEAIEKVRDFTPTPDQPQPDQPQQPQPQQQEQDEDGDQPMSGQPDMSDEQPEQPEQGSEPAPGDGDTDEQDTSGEPEAGDADDDGSEAETVEGQSDGDDGHEASESGAEADGSGQADGATTGNRDGDDAYDPSRDEDLPTDSPCVKDAARDEKQDYLLQQGAEVVTRGKREGMKRRVYHHKTSHFGSYKQGRTVVAIPRKGKRWVYDV